MTNLQVKGDHQDIRLCLQQEMSGGWLMYKVQQLAASFYSSGTYTKFLLVVFVHRCCLAQAAGITHIWLPPPSQSVSPEVCPAKPGALCVLPCYLH